MSFGTRPTIWLRFTAALTVWVKKRIFKEVATDEVILKGFCECRYVDYSNDILFLHSRLQQTTLKEVNAFLEEMTETQLDEETIDDELR